MTNEWNPIEYRECTEEEKQKYSEFYGWDIEDIKYTYDCKLPDDGEEVLITTKAGYIALTTYFNDDNYGCYFENYEDFDDVLAWMPLPEPYKK